MSFFQEEISDMASTKTSKPKSSRKTHVVPDFYGVYLLRSIPKPRSFYIGSTPDPIRRLRQHNGELTSGAYRTKRKGCRPWEMVLLVHGFPSKIAALQFEHAFQHAYQTRHILPEKRITTSKSSGNTLHHKLGNIRLLLNSTSFNRMNLQLSIFDNEIYHEWCMNKFGIKLSDTVRIDQSFTDISEFKEFLTQAEDKVFEKSKNVLSFGSHECSICHEDIDYTKFSKNLPLITICSHDGCQSVSHLICLGKEYIEIERDKLQDITLSQPRVSSQQFLKKQTGNINFSQFSQTSRYLVKNDLNGTNIVPPKPIIPIKGNCVGCGKILIWSKLVKMSTRFRQYAYKEEMNELESEVEEEEISESGFS